MALWVSGCCCCLPPLYGLQQTGSGCTVPTAEPLPLWTELRQVTSDLEALCRLQSAHIGKLRTDSGTLESKLREAELQQRRLSGDLAKLEAQLQRSERTLTYSQAQLQVSRRALQSSGDSLKQARATIAVERVLWISAGIAAGVLLTLAVHEIAR